MKMWFNTWIKLWKLSGSTGSSFYAFFWETFLPETSQRTLMLHVNNSVSSVFFVTWIIVTTQNRMDLTLSFVRIVNDLQDKLGIQSESLVKNKKHAIQNMSKSLFNTKLTELVSSISFMNKFLLDNKKDYINI